MERVRTYTSIREKTGWEFEIVKHLKRNRQKFRVVARKEENET